MNALEAHGTHEEAAAALGIRRDTFTKIISRLRKTAASKGYAPGHWEDGVAPGYRMGKVTVQRGPKGVERVWERQSPEVADVAALVREAVEAIRAETPREPISAAPKAPLADLLTEYTFTDYHLGMRAWDEEGGAAWSIEIAEDLLKKAIDFAASKAPASRKGLLAQLGDFLHFDSMLPVTPTSKHIVDADGHITQVFRAAVRCMRYAVGRLLEKHEEVIVVSGEGNHDITTSMALRELLKVLFENEPRVTIVDSPKPYYAYKFDKVMLAWTHGHVKRKENASYYFAVAEPEMWGSTEFRYGSSGHYHHEITVKEEPGMLWLQHPTLAPNDSYSARYGYLAMRRMCVRVFHKRIGLLDDFYVTPQILSLLEED